MKKIIFLLLFVTLGWQQAGAQTFTFGGLKYNVTSPDTVEVAYQIQQATAVVTIPAQVSYDSTTYAVTSIKDYAFYVCSSLTAVTIPNSVTSIGDSAFEACSSLTSVIIPSSVTGISYNTFGRCTGLTSITIPNTVTIIGDYAFSDCSSLTSVICNVTTPLTINANVFQNSNQSACSLTVPAASVSDYQAAPVWQNFSPIVCSGAIDNTTTISACTSYTWAHNNQTYTTSGVYTGTTTNCVTEKLDLTITTPPTSFTFNNLNYVVTGTNTVAVGSNSGASGAVTIPATVSNACGSYSVTSIGQNAFNGCSGLISVIIPDSVLNIGNSAFKFCSGLTAFTIPTSVTLIDNNAFQYSGLLSVAIPNSVTVINPNAFSFCQSLTSLTIPNSVTAIHAFAFVYCTNLTSLTIPNSVTYIGEYAFNSCSVTSVTCNLTQPLGISPNVFGGVNIGACSLTVPAGSVDAYRGATVWKDFAPIVASNTTWNGTAWSNGIPDATKTAIFTGNYAQATQLTAASVEVNGTAIVTVPSGFNYTVSGAVTVAATASLTFENNANLIQSGTTNDNTGNITIKRDSNLLKRLDYTMWSSPFTGDQTLLNFSPLTSAATPVRFYTYNSTSNLYTAATVGNPFATATGYLIRMPNENPAERGVNSNYYKGIDPLIYTGAFTGKPNNGTIPLNNLDSDKFYAVGNPYPSTLSADAFLSGNDTAGTLYFWRKTNGAGGTAYATYTYAGGVGVGDARDTGITPNGTIQVGQGFIVKATGNTLSFTNTMRTSNNENQFFKTKKVADKSMVWMSLSDAKGGLNQAMIAYIDGVTLGVDAGYDGKYFNDSKIALTSNIDSEEFVIQARPTFDASDVVALGFKTDVAGDYSIALDTFDGVFASGQEVYLVDAVAGKEIDLKPGAYSFTAAAGVDNARFSLKYQKTLKVDAPAFNDNSVKVYKNNGVIYVNSTSKAIKTITVYDAQGRLIAQQKNVNATTAIISNLKAVRQVLIVKISADDNSVVSKKVLN